MCKTIKKFKKLGIGTAAKKDILLFRICQIKRSYEYSITNLSIGIVYKNISTLKSSGIDVTLAK